MYRNKKVAVVVPAYNEEVLIRPTLSSMPDILDRIYAVDDCSKDRTGEVVKMLAKKDKRIVHIRHKANKGVGGAIATGYKQAVKDGMDIIAVMAGDNQMDPKYLPDLFDPIVDDKADYTKGNRLLADPYKFGMSPFRLFGNAILTFMTKISSGYWNIMDPQNGYSAIRAKAVKGINVDRMYKKYGYCNDLLVRLNIHNFRVLDVDIPARYGAEKSKIRYSTYIRKVSKLLLSDFFYRMIVKYMILSLHPLVFFYFLGFIMIVLGIVGIIGGPFYKYYFGGSLILSEILSLLVLMGGFQLTFFGMHFDMRASPGQENR
ncbi:MAG: glycosyltransferase family 2 protein [Thermoplasmatota archaeon]